MSTTLTDNYIADTYDGILHMDVALDNNNTTIQPVYDGHGNKTSLSVALENYGGKISGPLQAAGFNYPTEDGVENSIMVTDGQKNLTLKTLTSILGSGAFSGSGSYTNPTLVVSNGVITNIINVVRGGISALTVSGSFKVPTDVYKLKFYVTGGGGAGYDVAGNAGATVIGFMDVVPDSIFTCVVGGAGSTGSATSAMNGGNSSIYYGSDLMLTANGAVMSRPTTDRYTVTAIAATGSVTTFGSQNFITSYMIVPGGISNVATRDNYTEESPGAASFWGTGPAYGGGGGGRRSIQLGPPGSGVIVFEW